MNQQLILDYHVAFDKYLNDDETNQKFNEIQSSYIQLVKLSLVVFMSKIKEMILECSFGLYVLMNILILHFCSLINSIFNKIKSKILFYLNHVELQIYVDMLQFSVDLSDMKLLLLKLELEVDKYIGILETVKGLMSKLKNLLYRIRILKLATIIGPFNKLLNNIICKLKTICSCSGKYSGILCFLNQKISSLVIDVDVSSNSIIMTWKEMSNKKVSVSIKNINLSEITDFQKGVESIKNILEMIDLADRAVSIEIMSILGQLYILETINLVKLNLLITQIQLKYLDILVRGYLLVCTIEFLKEIQPTISSLIGSLKFECRNACGFLKKCSEVEKYVNTVSSSIDRCIRKLGEASNRSKCLGVRKELLKLYIHIIANIMFLKFYVDLMAMEILIFKMIILNLMWMTVISFTLDGLMFYIFSIKNIDTAIKTLIDCHGYLRTFYYIQIENTLVIFGLSNALRFSKYINQYYDVLVINLYWINWLIWVLECFIIPVK